MRCRSKLDPKPLNVASGDVAPDMWETRFLLSINKSVGRIEWVWGRWWRRIHMFLFCTTAAELGQSTISGGKRVSDFNGDVTRLCLCTGG